MRKPSPFLIIFLILLWLAHGRAAADPPAPNVAADAEVAAALAAMSAKAADRLALHPDLALRPAGTTMHLGQRLIAFDLFYRGLPVFFQRAMAQVDDALVVRRTFGGIRVVSPHVAAHPRPDAKRVLGWVKERGYPGGEVVAHGWLVVDGAWRPVVRVDTFEATGFAPLALYLDAVTGQIARTEPLVRYEDPPVLSDEPFGAVFLDNPNTTPEVALVPLTDLDNDTPYLYGAYARVETCVDVAWCNKTAPIATRSEALEEAFVFEPMLDYHEEPDPFAEVNTYWNVTRFNRWMREELGFSALFGESEWIEVRVGRAWDNAAYYAATRNHLPYLVFGKGTEADPINFSYDADTAFHEFGHAFADIIWKHGWKRDDALGIDISTSAIEEALSDILSQSFTGDPAMNGYVSRSRSAINDYTCPKDLVSESHYDGEILTGFAWDVHSEIGTTPFAHLFYRAVSYFEPEMDFQDLVFALEEAAQALAEENVKGVTLQHADVIHEKAKARGLLDSDCLSRLVPLGGGETHVAAGYGNRFTNKFDYPFGLQWRITAPQAATSLKLFLSWYYPTENANGLPVVPGFRVHLRRGAPVAVTWREPAELFEGEPAFDVIADETIEGSPEEVAYPHMDEAPLTPGEEIYVLLSADSDEPLIAVKAELRFSPYPGAPPVTDTAKGRPEPIDPGASAGGAACSTAAPGTGPRTGLSFLFLIGFTGSLNKR